MSALPRTKSDPRATPRPRKRDARRRPPSARA